MKPGWELRRGEARGALLPPQMEDGVSKISLEFSSGFGQWVSVSALYRAGLHISPECGLAMVHFT